MQKSDGINGIQASILRELFKQDGLRFAQLNVEKVPSDQFSYHLRQLIKYGLIEKSSEHTYSLSGRGKTRTIMLYPNENGFIEQGFLAVRIILSKTQKEQKFYLMQKRVTVPYQGTYATPGDKILFGEDVHVAARRVMKEQSNLTCDMQLRGVRHIKDNYQNEIVQDKYFFVFSATNPRGTLQTNNPSKACMWMSYDEIKSSGLSIHGGLELLQMVDSDHLQFDEQTYTVDHY